MLKRVIARLNTAWVAMTAGSFIQPKCPTKGSTPSAIASSSDARIRIQPAPIRFPSGTADRAPIIEAPPAIDPMIPSQIGVISKVRTRKSAKTVCCTAPAALARAVPIVMALRIGWPNRVDIPSLMAVSAPWSILALTVSDSSNRILDRSRPDKRYETASASIANGALRMSTRNPAAPGPATLVVDVLSCSREFPSTKSSLLTMEGKKDEEARTCIMPNVPTAKATT